MRLSFHDIDFGLQLDRETLLQFPARFHLMALGQAALTYAVFVGICTAVLVPLGYGDQATTMVVLAAGATAAFAFYAKASGVVAPVNHAFA